MNKPLPSQASGSRLLFADILRILAILAVISIHVHTYIFFNYHQEDDFDWWVSNILFTATKWAVPIFVMLSGTFLLSNQTKFSPKTFFLKRILKLLLPLVVWTVICKVFSGLFIPHSYSEPTTLIIAILKSDHLTYHLWFLYMLLGLYLISPVLKDFVKNEPIAVKYILILSFFANVILMLTIYFKVERVVYNPFYYFTGFIIYFVGGYYFYHEAISTRAIKMFYGGGVLAFLIGVSANFILLSESTHKWDIFIDNLSPFMILISTAVFLFFKRNNSFLSRFFSLKSKSYIQKLSAHSYGIYLIHTIILAFLGKYVGLKADSVNIFIGIPVTTLCVFFISLLIVVGIKRLKIFRWVLP